MDKREVLRYALLIFFVILFSIFALRHFVLGGDVAASIDALCPFGGFETLYTFIATGGFVPRVLMSSLVLAVGILLSVVILRKGFCGYICPFGFLQELFGRLNHKKLESKYDKKMRYVKYIVLAVVLIGTAVTGTLVFREYDPFVTFFHFGKGIFWGAEEPEHFPAFVVMVAVLAGSLFISRVWCRYLCPLAAVMNIFSWFGISKIERDKKTCIDCKICDKKCPMAVRVSDVDYVRDVECINCNTCVTSCPKDSLIINIKGTKLSVGTYVIFTLLLFFGAVGAAKAFGIWNSLPGTAIIDAQGELTGDMIKGWMTISDIERESGIDADIIIEQVGLPSDVDVNMPFNQIGANYGMDFHTESVRDFIDNYQESSEQIVSKPTCPWGIVDDPAPGLCGLYKDDDQNGLCDYSE